MSEHDSEALFPWETDAEAGTDPEAEAEAEAEGGADAASGSGADAATGSGADAATGSGADAATGSGADAAGEGAEAEDTVRFEVLDTEYARRASERANAALRDRPVAQKEYYAISEVCELVGLKPHVLRYWETQFPVLNPSKNRSGNRVYQRKEIRLIMLVKHLLYEEKYTVEGAKAKLEQLRRGGELADVTSAVLDRAMIEQLRADLTELATLLMPPARA